MKALTVCVLLSLLCARGWPQADSALVWPAPPDPPRIRHVATIGPQSVFKHEGGFFSKIVSLVFGEKRPSGWLVQPVGIAVSGEGLIYVADPGSHGIHIIDRAQQEYDFFSQSRLGKLLSPVGIAIAADGTIYVSDSDRGDIMVLNKDREPQYAFHDHLERPTGIFIVQKTLYVADARLHKVLMYDLTGKYLGEFGARGAGDGEFNYPVAVAGGNSIYVVDALNYRIQEFDPRGKFLSKFGMQGNAGGSFASPKSVALDSSGNRYVTDALMDNFQIFNARGQLLLIVGKHGDRDGQFMSPGGIAIDDHDNIYVVDMLNKRVQIFKFVK